MWRFEGRYPQKVKNYPQFAGITGKTVFVLPAFLPAILRLNLAKNRESQAKQSTFSKKKKKKRSACFACNACDCQNSRLLSEIFAGKKAGNRQAVGKLP